MIDGCAQHPLLENSFSESKSLSRFHSVTCSLCLLTAVLCVATLFFAAKNLSNPSTTAETPISAFHAPKTPEIHPDCKCIGGNGYGTECTRADHMTEWCYVDPKNHQCKHAKPSTTIPGNVWSVDPCYQADLCGHTCYDGVFEFGIDVCHATWAVGCDGEAPPRGVSSDTKILELCPHTCREELEILDSVNIKYPDGTQVPRDKVRIKLMPPKPNSNEYAGSSPGEFTIKLTYADGSPIPKNMVKIQIEPSG